MSLITKEQLKTLIKLFKKLLSFKADSSALNEKENKLVGASGQIVGFDKNGKAIAQNLPEGTPWIEKEDNNKVIYHKLPESLLPDDIRSSHFVKADAEGAMRHVNSTTEVGRYAFAEGYQTKAPGENSHAEGYNTTASGERSHAEGINTKAYGAGSHSEGINTTASGNYSHAEGHYTYATKIGSHAEGYLTETHGDYSHAEGIQTKASGKSSHSEGSDTEASGTSSHAEGYNTTASGYYSHAEGCNTKATTSNNTVAMTTVTTKGHFAHAEGHGSVAYGAASHAEGNGTKASGSYSHSEGCGTEASGSYSHSEGRGTEASGGSSHAEGDGTTASGNYSHAEGYNTEASGDRSHAEGQDTTASGASSHAEGWRTTASDKYSHAEGDAAEASGVASHAEGYYTKASGDYSHSEGYDTEASGDRSHAEGANTIASGIISHAEGGGTTASGKYSHAEGGNTTASGDYSHVEGYSNTANSKSQHVQGEYNVLDTENITKRGTYAHIVGNGTGTSTSARSNAHTLDWDGNAWFAGNVYVGSTSGTNKDTGSVKLVSETDLNNKGYITSDAIPTNVSAFTNDAGYLTEHQSLDGYATETYVNTHNTSTSAHNDIRVLIEGLSTRLNALADSDDTTLDQMSEIVAYIKSNKELIDGITTSKVNVSDIIDNLTTNVANKPLSAAQGVALKALIDAITVPTKVSELTNDSGYITSYTETDPTVPAWAKAATKPTYTAEEVGALPNTTVIPSLDGLATEEYVNIRVPAWTAADEGKFLRIVNGTPTWASISNAEEVSF